MHLPFSLVPILALVPLISGCVGQSPNTSVTARVPGSPAYDPFGLAEELFAERLDREPHLGDLLSNQPARSDWGHQSRWSLRPAFEEVTRIRLDRIEAALLTANPEAAETLQRIQAELLGEALEPALAPNRAPVGPLRGLLRTGILHLLLGHPIGNGADLIAFRKRLEALHTWTLEAAEHAGKIEGTRAPLPSTLRSLNALTSPQCGDLILETVSSKARLAVDLSPSLRLQTMDEIRGILLESLPAAGEALREQLDAPHRRQPHRGLVRQSGGLRLHRERIKQLISADLSLGQIETRLKDHSRELEEALDAISAALQVSPQGLDLLLRIREDLDGTGGNSNSPDARLTLLTQHANAIHHELAPLLPVDLEAVPRLSLLPSSLRPLTLGMLHQSAHHGRGRGARVWVDPERLRSASMDALAANWILGAAALATSDQEASDLPRWLRHARWPGWDQAIGLYLARLLDEVQPGRDPWQRAAALGLELECVAHGLTDIGLHLHGWTRAEAINYLGERSIATPARVELMVDDCLDRPALALAAPLTLQEVLQAREILRQGRGVAFDLFAFHGALLRVGALPVDLVQEGLLRRLRP